MNQIQKYLFYAFVVLLPLQTVYLLREVFIWGEKWQYGTIALYLSDIVLFTVIVSFVISRGYTRKILDVRFLIFDLKSRIKNLKSQAVLFVMLIFWSVLSIFWAQDQMLVAYSAEKLLLAAGVFFFARSLGEKEYRIVILLLIIGAALQSALGVWQFFAQSTFASTWLGMSAHEVWQAGTSVLKLEEGRWLRAYGTLPHPNMLGGFLGAVFVFGLAYFVACIEELKRNQRLVFLGGLIVILLGLIVTFSRAAWVGAALGIVAILFFQKSKIKNLKSKIVFGVLGIALAVLVGVLHEMVLPRFDGAAIEREGSVSERIQSLRDAERVIGEGNILLGTGVGNFTAAVMAMEPDRPVWSVQPAHNVFVLIFSELGLVGLLFFIGLLAVALLPLLKSSIINPQSAALAAFLPSFFLDHWLWTSHFGLLFFFLIAGLAARRY